MTQKRFINFITNGGCYAKKMRFTLFFSLRHLLCLFIGYDSPIITAPPLAHEMIMLTY